MILFRAVEDHRMAEPMILNSLSKSLINNLPPLSAEDVVNKLRVITTNPKHTKNF